MFQVVLINMPFANPWAPSLALTRLETYWQIGGGIDNLGTGLGEWFFRACAFPDLPDNADDNFQRYYLSPLGEEPDIDTHVPLDCTKMDGN
jgi:hypothetical protein